MMSDILKEKIYNLGFFNLIVYIVISFLFVQPMSGQISLLDLQTKKLSYKKALKQARKSGIPVLSILYSPNTPINIANELTNAENIIKKSGVLSLVIDWAEHPNKKPQKNISNLQNPTWVYIHPQDIVLSVSNKIVTDQQLVDFLQEGNVLYKKIDAAYTQNKKSGSSADLLRLAQVSKTTYDNQYTAEVLDNYIKRINPQNIDDTSLSEIIRIGHKLPVSKRLYSMINKHEDRVLSVADNEAVFDIIQSNILKDLNREGLLEPFYVWERYEKELDYKADSLYRLFAIGYFSIPPIDKESLYNEVFDYLNLYPHTDWQVLDHLYSIVLSGTAIKEDLEILLDLISFQILRKKSYKQLDYKAMILYKLGQKDRALGMIDKVSEAALSEGVKYRSLLYTLK